MTGHGLVALAFLDPSVADYEQMREVTALLIDSFVLKNGEAAYSLVQVCNRIVGE